MSPCFLVFYRANVVKNGYFRQINVKKTFNLSLKIILLYQLSMPYCALQRVRAAKLQLKVKRVHAAKKSLETFFSTPRIKSGERNLHAKLLKL